MRRPINAGNALGCLLNQSGATAARIDLGPLRTRARAGSQLAHGIRIGPRRSSRICRTCPSSATRWCRHVATAASTVKSLVVACTAPASSDACCVPRATFDRCTSAADLVRCMPDGMPGGMGFSQQDARCVQHATSARAVAQAKASGTGITVGFLAQLALVRSRMFASVRSHAREPCAGSRRRSSSR